MTNLELTRRAILLLAAEPSGEHDWYAMETEIGSLIPNALQELAEMIARDPERQGLLQQEYSVTLTNGIGNLTAATGARTAAADILWQSVSKGLVKDAYGGRLHYIGDRYAFEGPQLAGYNYYTLTDNGRIHVRTGADPFFLGGVSDPLTVNANFIPTVATLPAQLENDAVQTLAKIAVQKLVPQS